jgi:hypothetical protein
MDSCNYPFGDPTPTTFVLAKIDAVACGAPRLEPWVGLWSFGGMGRRGAKTTAAFTVLCGALVSLSSVACGGRAESTAGEKPEEPSVIACASVELLGGRLCQCEEYDAGDVPEDEVALCSELAPYTCCLHNPIEKLCQCNGWEQDVCVEVAAQGVSVVDDCRAEEVGF